MSCQELVELATDYLEDALAPAERAAFLPGSGPEARRLLTADRKAAQSDLHAGHKDSP